MNEKGNLIMLILLGFLAVLILPPAIMYLIPQADLLMRLVLVFIIFTFVRQFLGDGIPTILISAVLIYLLVVKYAYLTASLYVFFYVLMGIGALSMVVWGLGTTMGHKG